MSTILTVTQLNRYVKSVLESDGKLQNIYLRGEISNLTIHYTGHIYFSLKAEDQCTIKAVMFAGRAKYLKFTPQSGMKVIMRGNITLYEKTGSYQINVEEMYPDGAGALNLAYEQLKVKLQNEGLFDDSHKKPLPKFPQAVGVITSPTGAAVQDIFRILNRRYPIGEIIMCPVLVQGENAAEDLTNAVKKFNALKCADVIIIGRGGGSIEDLWAFNDEKLARAIYECEIPVVSAVGHETDFTICDFAADVRASTPSAAAELVSAVTNENMLAETEILMNKMRTAIQRRLQYESQRYERAANSQVIQNPENIITSRKIKLDMLDEKLKGNYSKKLSAEKEKFAELTAKLDTLSPLKILARGYSVAKKDGHIINSVEQANINDKIEIVLSDGHLDCTVTGGMKHEI